MTSLSIPTWVIHVSSVIEWVVAIWFVWIYADVSHNSAWKPFAFAMLPSLISAMCACTWHFFDNQPQLEWLVTLQAATTVLGNTTLFFASVYLWKRSQALTHKG